MQEPQKNISLKTLNTFGIDVSAELFSSFNNEEELKHLIELNKNEKKEVLILGGGSNILFTKNPEQWVWQNCIKGIEVISDASNEVLLKVGAGENWHNFVLYCVDKNWGGIENLSLIPGCVGAGPMQNIGEYGAELKDTCHAVECIERKTGQSKTFTAQECEFGYRESIFKQKVKDQHLTDKVTLINKLPKDELMHFTYNADLGLSIDKNTNLNYYYSLPNKVFDYMHAGVPILATRLPEIEKLITHYNIGDFTENHDPEALALKINEMLSSHKLQEYKRNTIAASYELNWLAEKVKLKAIIDQVG